MTLVSDLLRDADLPHHKPPRAATEVAFAAEDPMEGCRAPQVTGPAVSLVREMLRG